MEAILDFLCAAKQGFGDICWLLAFCYLL